MATQYFQEKKLTKRTKTRTADIITSKGILEDGDEEKFKTFEEYYADFTNQPVVLSVSITSKEDLIKGNKIEEE